MAQRIFSAGTASRVLIRQLNGDLSVYGWDGQTIKIETDGNLAEVNQEGNLLLLIGCDDDVEMWIPFDGTVSGIDIDGDVEVRGIQFVELKNIAGDVDLQEIAGAVDLTDIGADLEVTNTPQLVVHGGVSGDASLSHTNRVEIETIGADMELDGAETVLIGSIGGDLRAEEIKSALRCGVVGGDCRIEGTTETETTIGNVGAYLDIEGAANVQVGNVGGDCNIENVAGSVEIGFIGADIKVDRVAGALKIGGVGGDANLEDLHGSIEIGSIGGDLSLQTEFPPDSNAHLNVGGDAEIQLPNNASLNIRATVGGDISGHAIVSSSGGNMINLVYGEGQSQLDLIVGGDLDLRGEGNPRSSSSASWSDFGREMAGLGREMEKLGRELSDEISSAFSKFGQEFGKGLTDDVIRHFEDRVQRAQQKAEERAAHTQEEMHRQQERAARVRVRINNREWQLDPERLERIKEQARNATSEGIAGALDAVERAMRNLRVPTPPMPPMPPTPPKPPTPPFTAQPNRTGTGGSSPVQGQQNTTTNPPKATPPATESNLEQEREAILRMIAEGRVTAEEGDLLLESLGG